ncbi:unnamed protein product [Meloidogyne enterolobii]|uniref:Uncharacterized protein n=2 Tax=Meloidogyne enterolobii TaxID=390850 RepID=A0A6V7XT79_MELEN|nr:unnamed protein product [Meloidogyne enterolobii]
MCLKRNMDKINTNNRFYLCWGSFLSICKKAGRSSLIIIVLIHLLISLKYLLFSVLDSFTDCLSSLTLFNDTNYLNF